MSRRDTSGRVSAVSGWAEAERILALELYVTDGPIGRGHPKVRALSDELKLLALHPEAGTRTNFRNPNGVAMKLANFAAIDPHGKAGLSGCSIGDRETWAKYATDADLLHAEAGRIRSAGRTALLGSPGEPAPGGPSEPRLSAVEPSRRALLAQRFSQWTAARGHEIERRSYQVGATTLHVDLYDTSTSTTWEVVGVAGRSTIRSAIGTLIDLSRFDPAGRLGVVLPWAPTEDLQTLLRSIDVQLALPIDELEFEIR